MSDKKTPSIQSPLAKARGLGSAKTGTHHWWMQRLTAVFLVLLAFWLVTCINCMLSPDHGSVVFWLTQPINLIVMTLFVITGYYHAALGSQVIIEDYVHKESLKIVSLLIVNFACFALCIASLIALMLVAFQNYGV